jgi:hypothetical protein
MILYGNQDGVYIPQQSRTMQRNNGQVLGRHEVDGSDLSIFQPQRIMKCYLSHVLLSFHPYRFESAVFTMRSMPYRVNGRHILTIYLFIYAITLSMA